MLEGAVMSRQTVDRQPRTSVPFAGLPRRSRDELLMAAHHGLDEASFAQTPGQRYALAHLAALRAAAAVLVDRARPRYGHRGRPVSVWRLLATVAPELGEWSQFFAAGAVKRTAAEAGLSVVGTRDADDLLRQAETFLAVVETTLGLPSQPVLAVTVIGSAPFSSATYSPGKTGV